MCNNFRHCFWATSTTALDQDAVRIRLDLRRRDPTLPRGSLERSSDMSGPYRQERRTCSEASRNGGSRPTESRISRVPGWIAVARAWRCGCSSRSMSRTLTPWRASSPAANNPDGPAPIIRTSFRVIRLPRKYSHIGSTLSPRSKYLSGARETLSIISAAFSR